MKIMQCVRACVYVIAKGDPLAGGRELVSSTVFIEKP